MLRNNDKWNVLVVISMIKMVEMHQRQVSLLVDWSMSIPLFFGNTMHIAHIHLPAVLYYLFLIFRKDDLSSILNSGKDQ